MNNARIFLDKLFDYTPFFSTFSNAIDIVQKKYTHSVNSDYNVYIQNKSLTRMFFLLIPVVSNITIIIWDVRIKIEKKRILNEVEQKMETLRSRFIDPNRFIDKNETIESNSKEACELILGKNFGALIWVKKLSLTPYQEDGKNKIRLDYEGRPKENGTILTLADEENDPIHDIFKGFCTGSYEPSVFNQRLIHHYGPLIEDLKQQKSRLVNIGICGNDARSKEINALIEATRKQIARNANTWISWMMLQRQAQCSAETGSIKKTILILEKEGFEDIAALFKSTIKKYDWPYSLPLSTWLN